MWPVNAAVGASSYFVSLLQDITSDTQLKHLRAATCMGNTYSFLSSLSGFVLVRTNEIRLFAYTSGGTSVKTCRLARYRRTRAEARMIQLPKLGCKKFRTKFVRVDASFCADVVHVRALYKKIQEICVKLQCNAHMWRRHSRT